MAAKTLKAMCDRIKWRVIPFAILFFVTVAVLLGVYRFRLINKADELDPSNPANRKGLKQRGRTGKHGEEGPTHDRWLILSDDQEAEYTCALAEVSAELGWRTLIVGRNASCCRKSCILLNSHKMKSLNYEILAYVSPNNTVTRRNVAFLYAIQHGARHIFDAYPSTYVAASMSVEQFRTEMHRQLHNLTLDVALGLVSERPYVKRVQNPYAHFGRPDLWTEGFRRNNQRDVQNHVYRICEVRPPSMEKFLETDVGSFDLAAPALTLPGATLAPFSSKNTLYSLEAFWGLPLLPGKDSSSIPAHLFRTLWNQAILGDIAGSMRLSLSTLPTLQRREKTRKDPSELREPSDGFASFLLKWSCSTRSSLGCVHDLAQNMFQLNYISSREAEFLDAWIADLTKLRYLEPPIIPRRRGYMNPCLGADGLYGVTFFPSLQPRNLSEEQQYRRNQTLTRYLNDETLLDYLKKPRADPGKRPEGTEGSEVTTPEDSSSFSHRHGKTYDAAEDDGPLLREFAESMCPGYSSLLPYRSEAAMGNVLLVIAMTSNRYDLIPMFEVIYRQHFKNILYCGSPHDSIEIFLRKYQLSESRSFSFLPAHTKHTYECLMGALEMGYNVEGYLMTSDDTLINTWNIPTMNFSKVWYGSDNDIVVTDKEWKSLDPGGQKLPRSLEGVLKVVEFLKSALIGSHEDQNAYYQASRLSKREADPVKEEEENNPNVQLSDVSSESTHSFILETPDEKHPHGQGHLLVDIDSVLPSLKYELVNDTFDSLAGSKNDTLNDTTIEVASLEEGLLTEEDEIDEDDDDVDETETDSERPVAELLRKLLVATRNNTQNATSTETPESTTLPANETEETNSTTVISATITTTTTVHSIPLEEDPIEISAKAKEIFHLEDEWDKITVHTNTSNPALELFIHSVPSAEPEPEPLPEHSDQIPAEEQSQKDASENPGTGVIPSENPPHDPALENPTGTNHTEVVSHEIPSVTTSETVPQQQKETVDPAQPEELNSSSPVVEERSPIDIHVEETLLALKNIYTVIKENLGVPVVTVTNSENTNIYGGDRSHYRLDPKTIPHFRCEKGTGLEFCKVSSEFLYQLLENVGESFQPYYDKVPMYYIPNKHQLKFYLLSNLMLQHGVTDEIAVPLILSGLSSQEEWLKLEKSYFGAKSTTTGVFSKYPLFNSTAAYLYPSDLNTVLRDSKIQKVFCLKYLLRIMKT